MLCRAYKTHSEKQAEINRKQSLRTLTWIMDGNFSGKDIYVTYSFEKDRRPGDPKIFRACVKQFLKQLRKIYRKAGITLKYIWVGERGERGAEHIHMVQSGSVDVAELKKAWPHGWINVMPMDESGSYHKLASYFIKYSDIRKRKRLDPGAIEVPEGYYLDKETVQSGVQENGYEFLEYTLVLLPGYHIPAHDRANAKQNRQSRQRRKKRSR